MVYHMAKATGNISQRPISVKLNKEQILVLDRIVENGEFNGRSHALRELVMPALQAGVMAMNTGKGWKGMMTYALEIKKLSKKMDAIAENSKDLRDLDGQVTLDLEGIPKIVPSTLA